MKVDYCVPNFLQHAVESESIKSERVVNTDTFACWFWGSAVSPGSDVVWCLRHDTISFTVMWWGNL